MVAISCATENEEQEKMFIIYTIEIYACLTIYLLSNIAILVEKTMIGTHMRIKFGFFSLTWLGPVKADLLYMNWRSSDRY